MYQKSFIYSILSFLPKILADSEQIPYSTPEPNANAHFVETFDNGIPNTWYHTLGNKQDEEQNKYSGEFTATALKNNALEGDLGLVAPKKANHYGIGSKLNQPFVFAEEEQLVVSYEVNFQDGLDCGGGYIKLFAEQDDLDIEKFHDKTLFSIMFGPDKCANDFKLHLIVNHRNPITNEYEEKHARMPKADVLKPYYTDAKTHVYKLVLGSDNSYTIYIDGKNVNAGNLLKDMQPAINPPKEIEDPNSVKPEDWDEREKIQDPEATKPEDWDEDAPKEIPDLSAKMPSDWREDLEAVIDDPEAIMPEDWDEDMDGEYEPPSIPNPECEKISGCGLWEPPLIKNPAYKGKWRAPMIDNPNFQGIWKPDIIANPDYFEDNTPFSNQVNIAAVAIEIWSMNDNIYFDNFMVSNNEIDVNSFIAATHALKAKQVKANEPSLFEKIKEKSEDKAKVVVGSVLGIGVVTILIYFAFFRKNKDAKNVKFADKNEEKTMTPAESEAEEPKIQEIDEDAAGDAKEDDTKASEKELNDSENQESSENEEAEESDEDLAQKRNAPRKRNVRRKAD